MERWRALVARHLPPANARGFLWWVVQPENARWLVIVETVWICIAFAIGLPASQKLMRAPHVATSVIAGMGCLVCVVTARSLADPNQSKVAATLKLALAVTLFTAVHAVNENNPVGFVVCIAWSVALVMCLWLPDPKDPEFSSPSIRRAFFLMVSCLGYAASAGILTLVAAILIEVPGIGEWLAPNPSKAILVKPIGAAVFVAFLPAMTARLDGAAKPSQRSRIALVVVLAVILLIAGGAIGIYDDAVKNWNAPKSVQFRASSALVAALYGLTLAAAFEAQRRAGGRLKLRVFIIALAGVCIGIFQAVLIQALLPDPKVPFWRTSLVSSVCVAAVFVESTRLSHQIGSEWLAQLRAMRRASCAHEQRNESPPVHPG